MSTRSGSRPRPWARAAVALAAAPFLTSCAASELPPSPPTVQVTMRDFRYDFDPGSLTRGRVVLRVTNAGPLYHELALVSIPENLPPLDAQVRSGERQIVSERASSPNLQAGASDTFAVDLSPGRWGFVCFVIGPEGSHAAKGMAAEFRVR